MVYRTIQLRKSPSDGGGGTLLSRLAPAGLAPAIVNSATRFTLGTTGWLQTDVTSEGSLQMAIPDLPVSGHLLEVRVKVEGGTGHVGLPATMPTVQVVRSLNNGALLLGSTVTDTSATVAAYEVAHELVVAFNFDLGTSDFDWLQINLTGETGANSLANQFRLQSVDLVFGP